MLFGGSSRFSPPNADSCLPDVSGCPRIALSDSHRPSPSPKLPFGSDQPTPAALHFESPTKNPPVSGKSRRMNTCAKMAGGTPVQETRITGQIQLESGGYPRRNRPKRQSVV
jgi:hypothetical protein